MGEKSIKLNFFYNTLLQISKVIFPLITAPYVARVLEPDGVGLYNFAATYANYFALFAALGVPMYGIREIAKCRGNRLETQKFVSEIFSISLFTTLITSFVFVLTIYFIPQLNEDYIIFLLSGLVLYLTPIKVDWFFQGSEEFGFITLRSLIVKILSVISLFLFVHVKEDLIIYVIIAALSSVLNETWNFVKLLKTGIRPKFTIHFFQHIKPLLILFASVVAISVYKVLDSLMLGFISDYTEVGYYNSASHLVSCLQPIVTSLAAVALPRISYYFKSDDIENVNGLVKKSISVVSFLCFPMVAAMIVIAPIFVPLFFGDQFYGAVLPTQIVVGLVVAIGFNNLLGIQILVGKGLDKLFLYCVIVGAVANFTMNLYMIPRYGAVGASIASVISESLILIVEIWMVQKYTPVKFRGLNNALKSIIASIGLLVLGYFMKIYFDSWWFVLFYVVFGGFFYLIFMYIIKQDAMCLFVDMVYNKIKKN